MLSSPRVAPHPRVGLQDMQQLQGAISNLTLRLGRGNQRGFRTGMKRKRTIDGEAIKEGEEAEVVADEDLVEETEVTVGEEGIEEETEATEEGIEAGMIESMMIGERIEGTIESMMTEVTDRVEDTEVVVRMEVVVDTEVVVELRGGEEAQEVEGRTDTEIRKHVITTYALIHSEPTLGFRSMLKISKRVCLT